MPTGYTSFIADGNITTGKDFLMLCVREFGACIDMRDDPLSTPVPKQFEAHIDYYVNNIDELKKKLETIKNLDYIQVQKTIDEEYEQNQIRYKQHIQEEKELYDKYMKVRAEVESWLPPSKDHKELKKFALNQIDISLPDTNSSYWEEYLKEPKPTVQEWLDNNIYQIESDIKYYTKEMEEEIQRTKDRNKWLQLIRESF